MTSEEKLEKQKIKAEKEHERLLELSKYEREYNEKGFELIGGIDEAGRGPLFGPVVAACVVLPKGCLIEGVNDSKKLSEKKREALFDEIKEKAVAWGVGIVDNNTIDEINILEATRKAMHEAVENLQVKPLKPPLYALKNKLPIQNWPGYSKTVFQIH